MEQYIPGGIFRASFKFCMGEKLRQYGNSFSASTILNIIEPPGKL
jgi:hypothetical protein